MSEKKKGCTSGLPDIRLPLEEITGIDDQCPEHGEKQDLPKNNTIDFGPYSTARYYNPGCWCEGGNYYCGC